MSDLSLHQALGNPSLTENPGLEVAVRHLETTFPTIRTVLAPFKDPQSIYHFARAILEMQEALSQQKDLRNLKTQLCMVLRQDPSTEMKTLALLELRENGSPRELQILCRSAYQIMLGWLKFQTPSTRF